MAEITFEADGFVVGVEMFAIVAAEAARGLHMSQIIGVCLPIDFLIEEDGLGVNRLNLGQGRFNEFGVLGVEIGIAVLVEVFQAGNGLQTFRLRFVGHA